MSEKHIVVQGATCTCKYSNESQNDVLKVKTQSKHYTNDKDGSEKVLGVEVVKFDFSKLEVTIYPNPAKDFIKLNIGIEEASAKVKLISLSGQTLLSKKIATTGTIYLDIRNVKSGNYILQVESGKRISVHKMIVLK